jgi:hypothetical protein
VDNVLNYANSGVWDPLKKEARFVGQGHYEAEKMLIYSDSANAWRLGPAPVQGPLGHGYAHNTIDPSTGVSYYRGYYSTSIDKYEDGAWSLFTNMPGTADSYTCCGALVYDPAYGGLTFWSGRSVLGFKHNQWTTLTENLGVGGYHNVAQYSKPYKVTIGGGGYDSRTLYAMDSTGSFSNPIKGPEDIGVHTGILTVAPKSGDLILLSSVGTLWALTPGKEWRQLPSPAKEFLENESPMTQMTVAISIETYNVIMFLHRRYIALYKPEDLPLSISNRTARIGKTKPAAKRNILGRTLPKQGKKGTL